MLNDFLRRRKSVVLSENTNRTKAMDCILNKVFKVIRENISAQ
jgi:uncharacterized protein (DUF2267 family)